jgi:alanine racemase
MVRVQARVDLAAIERNVARLRRELSGGTRLCPVVKAEGYGHGAVPAARAALAGGAEWLAVAAAQEAAALRAAGIDDVPILVMGALGDEELAIALRAGADVVAWEADWIARLPADARVHVKLDTGMGRLGTRDPAQASEAAAAAGDRLVGAMTHFATADERGDAFFGEQLARFQAWVADVRATHPDVIVHAANSAGTLRDPAAHFDMVRPGVAIYGMDPFGEDAAARDLEPALELVSRVAAVKACAAGESTGYGRRFVAERDTTVATVPIGYGDGWRRALTNNADVAIGGRRFPLVGTVSMDNITVDLGPDGGGVAVDDEVHLIGGGISAEEVARRLGTINYEVTTALLPRAEHRYHRDGEPV